MRMWFDSGHMADMQEPLILGATIRYRAKHVVSGP